MSYDPSELLTIEQEREFKARLDSGDDSARAELIELGMPMAARIARKYRNRGLDAEDLESAGWVGLIKGVDKFDPDKCRFGAFLYFRIKGEIRKKLRDEGSMIRVPSELHDVRYHRDAAIADDRIEGNAAGRLAAADAALGLKAGSIKDDDKAADFLANIGDHAAFDALGIGLGRLSRLMEYLDPKELEVIRSRFGIDGRPRESLDSIGRRMKLTPEKVARVEANALDRLRMARDWANGDPSAARLEACGPPRREPDGPATFKVRGYQASMIDRAVAAIRAGSSALLDSPTGSGKTTMAVIVSRILMTGGDPPISRVVIAAPQRHIEDGFRLDRGLAARWPGPDPRDPLEIPPEFVRSARHLDRSVSAIRDYLASPDPGHALACTHAAWMHLAAESGDELPDLSSCLLVVDECFPSGTIIDGKPIELIRPGEMVNSFNHESREIERHPVVRLFRRKPSSLVRVHFADGTSLVCTADHPIFCHDLGKYVDAKSISRYNTVYRITRTRDGGSVDSGKDDFGDLRGLQRQIRDERQAQDRRLAEGGPDLLFEGMLGRISATSQFRDDGENQSDSRIRSNEGQESHEEGGYSRQGQRVASRDGMQASGPGRKRHGPDSAAVAPVLQAGMADGVYRQDENPRREEFPLSESLQIRHSQSDADDRDRGGWSIPSRQFEEGSRREKAGVLVVVGVDRVEILEPGSDGRFGGMCPDGLVYNLEVERNHNYFADGFLVHNCHHGPARALSATLDRWAAAGGRLLYCTATPYRSDGKLVARDGMVEIRRSLAQHMREGHAPRQIDHAIIPFGTPESREVDGREFTGSRMVAGERRQAALAGAIVDRWIMDGKPKAIVRVPPFSFGSGPFVRKILEAFRAEGAWTLDATGMAPKDQRRLLNALRAERRRSFAESKYGVIVGIQRVLEGADWPLCSTVYSVGIPGAVGSTVQLLGRATRKKREDHPDRDVCRIVFFVPAARGGILESIPIRHARIALLTCAYLADHKAGSAWSLARSVRRGLQMAGFGKEDSGVDDVPCGLADRQKAAVLLAVARAMEGEATPTVQAVLEASYRSSLDADRSEVERLVIGLIASQSDELGSDVRRAMAVGVAEAAGRGLSIDRAISSAFAIVTEEFRSSEIRRISQSEFVNTWACILTEGGIEKWARKLSLDRGQWDMDAAIAKAREYAAEHGKLPTGTSGEIEGWPGRNWEALEAFLRYRGDSLPKFFARHFPEYYQAARITDEWAKARIGEYLAEHGKLPTADRSGAVRGCPNLTWRRVDLRLRSRGSSLDELKRQFPGHYRERVAWSEAEIVELARRHLDLNGRLPTQASGEIIGTGGRNWSSADAWLARRKKSLSVLLRQHFPEGYRPAAWSESLIVEIARDYIDRHGRPPSRTCCKEDFGLGDDCESERGTREVGGTWQAAHRWLLKERGLHLRELIAHHFPEYYNEEGNLLKRYYSAPGPVES